MDKRHGPKSPPSRGLTLGLGAFQKIAAVEGMKVSGRMIKTLKAMDAKKLDATLRTRLIMDTYGKTPA